MILPLIIGPFTASFSSASARVSTSLFPFSFSVSFSFGSGVTASEGNHRHVIEAASQQTATYIPQTIVLGALSLLFVARLATNVALVRRSRRRREDERRQRLVIVSDQHGNRTVRRTDQNNGAEGRRVQPPET